MRSRILLGLVKIRWTEIFRRQWRIYCPAIRQNRLINKNSVNSLHWISLIDAEVENLPRVPRPLKAFWPLWIFSSGNGRRQYSGLVHSRRWHRSSLGPWLGSRILLANFPRRRGVFHVPCRCSCCTGDALWRESGRSDPHCIQTTQYFSLLIYHYW